MFIRPPSAETLLSEAQFFVVLLDSFTVILSQNVSLNVSSLKEHVGPASN